MFSVILYSLTILASNYTGEGMDEEGCSSSVFGTTLYTKEGACAKDGVEETTEDDEIKLKNIKIRQSEEYIKKLHEERSSLNKKIEILNAIKRREEEKLKYSNAEKEPEKFTSDKTRFSTTKRHLKNFEKRTSPKKKPTGIQ